jgi:hypothetical protein
MQYSRGTGRLGDHWAPVICTSSSPPPSLVGTVQGFASSVCSVLGEKWKYEAVVKR